MFTIKSTLLDPLTDTLSLSRQLIRVTLCGYNYVWYIIFSLDTFHVDKSENYRCCYYYSTIIHSFVYQTISLATTPQCCREISFVCKCVGLNYIPVTLQILTNNNNWSVSFIEFPCCERAQGESESCPDPTPVYLCTMPEIHPRRTVNLNIDK